MEGPRASCSNRIVPSSDQPVGSNQNPMLIHEVTRNMFTVIPFQLEEFKKLRQVCHLWNDYAAPVMYENAWLKLEEGSTVTLFYGNRRSEFDLLDSILLWLEEPSEPLKFLEKTLKFRKYLIIDKVMNLTRRPRGDHFKFWDKFGPLMTHLELSECFLSPNDLRKIVIEMTPNLKVLKLNRNHMINYVSTLPDALIRDLVWEEGFRPQQTNKHLTQLTIINDGTPQGFSINWIDLISHFPNIKTLKLGLHDRWHFYGVRYLEQFFQAMILVRQNCGQHYLARLEHLDIIENPHMFIDEQPSEIPNLLRQISFPLKALALDIGGRLTEMGIITLETILELHSTTLQNLTVFRKSLWPKLSRFPYSHLPQLTQLILIGSTLENLCFLRNLPNLEMLVMLDGKSEIGVLNLKKEWSTTLSSSKLVNENPTSAHPLLRVVEKTNFYSRELKGLVLPNLKAFIIGEEFCNKEQITKLAALMPNVRTLQLGMGNDGFRMVCKYWGQLEHLDINPMDVNEEGIFGIKNGKRYCLPNITDLKSLKSISLGFSSAMRGMLEENLKNRDVTAPILLPNLEAALSGRAIEVYRQVTLPNSGIAPGMLSPRSRDNIGIRELL
ncbi:unnamed protein product [Orchesella dallaii]|uniref:F-box domain-containing protein n=1 Tax=Orchesella dallaii TaxID=48710 RepID=A0ABP1RU42_9HEXA